MAQIQDRKRDFFSQKQSVRDESSAPIYLESAGDVLLKKLSEKQLNTKTTLEDQLKISQTFHGSYQLNPDMRKGLSTFKELHKQILEENEREQSSGEIVEKPDISAVLKEAGLTRHEVQLALCEKPESKISKLYTFAVGNKKKKVKTEIAERLLPNHPINSLVEIHEEYFGHLKKNETKDVCGEEFNKDTPKSAEKRRGKFVNKRKKKKRKRRKKCTPSEDSHKSTNSIIKSLQVDTMTEDEPEKEEKKEIMRPSLWDVKDMKKWCESKKVYGCKPQTLYTLKDGKIIKLENVNCDST